MSERRRAWAVVSVACAIGVVLSAVLAGTRAGVNVDRDLLDALKTREYSGLWYIVSAIDNHILDAIVIGTLLSAAVTARLSGARPALLIPASVVLAGALAEVLKDVIVIEPSSRLLIASGSSWPSAHIATVAALALSVMQVARTTSARFFVAAVAILCTGVCTASLLIMRSHSPTDLIGGWLVAGFAVASVAGALVSVESPSTSPYRRPPSG